jgi:tetratricopeptide (TPR) repeat protein
VQKRFRSRGPKLISILLLLGVAAVVIPTSAQFLPRPPKDPRLERAKVAFESGRYQESAELLEGFVQRTPDNAEAWLFLGWSRYRISDFEGSREAFESSLRLDDSIDGLVGLGYASLQLHGPEAATRFFQQALERDATRGDALRGLVISGRRHDAPSWVIQEGALAARRLETLEGKDVETLIASETLRAGVERRLRPVSTREGPPEVPTRAGVDYLEERMPDGNWRPIFIKGVNLGVALPGRFAAEFPTDERLYREWLEIIADLGANAIRLYTLLPPSFYRALDRHNAESSDPLWLIQGVWSELPPRHDFSDPQYLTELHEDIARVIDAVHGNIAIGPTQDHAWGSYDHDVSRWLLAWIIGREWEPFAVVEYNEMYPERTSFAGRWLVVEEAQAMEVWVAALCDFAVDYEARLYHEIRPVSFANWPTLDPLHHPTESTREEEYRMRLQLGLRPPVPVGEAWDDDAVTLDTTRIIPTDEMEAGIFASYHIYPNFPGFMNHQYQDARDALGPNQYVGYLRALKEYHGDQPVLVAEFGISTSRGIAQVQPLGWHHGGLGERAQGQLVSRMFRNIYDESYAGGVIFEFIDEWFKGTWNVAPFEIPDDRRRFWFNAESPEQSYGLLAVRPASLGIGINGNLEEWEGVPAYGTD